MWNSRGGWKKYQKLIVGGKVGIVGGLEKTKNFNSRRGWLLNFLIAFFFPFLTMKTAVLRTLVYTVKVK